MIKICHKMMSAVKNQRKTLKKVVRMATKARMEFLNYNKITKLQFTSLKSIIKNRKKAWLI